MIRSSTHSPQRRITLIRHAMPHVDATLAPETWELSDSGIATAVGHPQPASGATVVSSPERKSLQTTALMTGLGEDGIPVDARFREVDRDERVHDGFRAARAAWVAADLDDRHAGWETPDAAAQRFHEGLLAHPAEHLIVGTHGMVLTAWLVAQGLVAPGHPAVAFWDALSLPDVIDVSISARRVRGARRRSTGS